MSVDRRSLVAGTMAAAAATALNGPAAKALPQRSPGRAGRPDPMAPARLHRRVRELCDFQPRWAGYRAERQAGAWLARRLRDAGLDVEVDRYTFRKWQLDGWRTTLLSAQGRRVLPSFPIWSTAAGRGTAPELLARDLTGAVAVVTGKALLNVFASYPDTYHRAAELGAVAMVVTSDAPDNLIRPTSSGRNLLDENPIPAFQLGAQDLAAVRAAARVADVNCAPRRPARVVDFGTDWPPSTATAPPVTSWATSVGRVSCPAPCWCARTTTRGSPGRSTTPPGWRASSVSPSTSRSSDSGRRCEIRATWSSSGSPGTTRATRTSV